MTPLIVAMMLTRLKVVPVIIFKMLYTQLHFDLLVKHAVPRPAVLQPMVGSRRLL